MRQPEVYTALYQALEGRHNTAQGVNPVKHQTPHPPPPSPHAGGVRGGRVVRCSTGLMPCAVICRPYRAWFSIPCLRLVLFYVALSGLEIRIQPFSNPIQTFQTLFKPNSNPHSTPFPVRVTTIQIVIPLFQQLLGFLLYVATVCSGEGGEVELEGDAGGFQVMVVRHRHIFISLRVGE